MPYHMNFKEIGTDEVHVNFPVQTAPAYYGAKATGLREKTSEQKIDRHCPDMKNMPGGELRSGGHFASNVGR